MSRSDELKEALAKALLWHKTALAAYMRTGTKEALPETLMAEQTITKLLARIAACNKEDSRERERVASRHRAKRRRANETPEHREARLKTQRAKAKARRRAKIKEMYAKND